MPGEGPGRALAKRQRSPAGLEMERRRRIGDGAHSGDGTRSPCRAASRLDGRGLWRDGGRHHDAAHVRVIAARVTGCTPDPVRRVAARPGELFAIVGIHGPVARRPLAGIRRRVTRRKHRSVDSFARFAGRPSGRGHHRRRLSAVLVAGQPVRRLLSRTRKAQEGRRRGRLAANARRRLFSNWSVESRRRDSLQATL